MDVGRFDRLAHTLGAITTRRGTLAAALGGPLAFFGADTAGARKKKKPCPLCTKRKKGRCKKTLPDGADCGGGKVCRGGACACLTACCAQADCGAGRQCQSGTCVCPSGQRECRGTCIPAGNCCTDAECGASEVYLLNGSCLRACLPGESCGPGCMCGFPSVEGSRHCTANGLTCAQTPQPCTSTADCQPDWWCEPRPCGPGGSLTNRCVGTC